MTLFQSKNSSTFRLSDSYNTPDRSKLTPTKAKGEASEITLAIKTFNSTDEVRTLSDHNLERKLEECQEMLDESYRSRRELQLSIEETTHQLSEMIKTQDNIIKQHIKEKDEMKQKLKDSEEKINLEKNKANSLVVKIQELESTAEVAKLSEKQLKSSEK